MTRRKGKYKKHFKKHKSKHLVLAIALLIIFGGLSYFSNASGVQWQWDLAHSLFVASLTYFIYVLSHTVYLKWLDPEL